MPQAKDNTTKSYLSWNNQESQISNHGLSSAMEDQEKEKSAHEVKQDNTQVNKLPITSPAIAPSPSQTEQ